MLNISIGLAFAAALGSGASGAAPQKAADVPAIKVTQSGLTQSVDCSGADLMVSGDNDKLDVRNCATINVVGNANVITAHLLPASTIAALGSHNHIVFIHAPGFEAVVSSTGVGNEIVPDLSRDAVASAAPTPGSVTKP